MRGAGLCVHVCVRVCALAYTGQYASRLLSASQCIHPHSFSLTHPHTQVTVNTDIQSLDEYTEHICQVTNMRCLTLESTKGRLLPLFRTQPLNFMMYTRTCFHTR